MTTEVRSRTPGPAIAFLVSLCVGLMLAGLSFAGLADSPGHFISDHFLGLWLVAMVVALGAELAVGAAAARSRVSSAVAIWVGAVLAPLIAIVAFFGYLLFQD